MVIRSYSLLAHRSQLPLFRWHALKRKAPKQNRLKALGTKKSRHAARGEISLCGARDQIRTGDPHVGNVLRSLNSLMFTGFYVRRGA